MENYFPTEDVVQNKSVVLLTCILCIFCPILFFLPLVCCKDSEYGKFYANQCLLLFIAVLVGAVTAAIVVGIVIEIVAFVFAIMNAVNASKGIRKGIPLLGNIAILK